MSETNVTQKKRSGGWRRLFRSRQGSISNHHQKIEVVLPSRSQDASPAASQTVAPLASQESNPNPSHYSSRLCRSPTPPSQEPNSTISPQPGTATFPALQSNSATNQKTADIPGRNLWNKALAKLSKEDGGFILEHSPPAVTNIKTTLDSLHKAVEAKHETCEEKRWVFNLNGQKMELSKLAQKVCVWLDKFKDIGDIVVNVDPLHAGVPWAAIRLFLQVHDFGVNTLYDGGVANCYEDSHL
jgi:hypothetical protein